MLYGEAEDHTMKLFQRMDRQGKGYLSALDLKRGMKLIGLSLTNEQVEQLIIEMDDNGDGKIQPEELSAAIHEGGRNPKVMNVRKVALFLLIKLQDHQKQRVCRFESNGLPPQRKRK